MNGKLIMVAAACVLVPFVEARGNAIAEQIRARAVQEWLDAQNAQPEGGSVTPHDDTPQRATGWEPSSGSSDDAPLVTKKRIGSDEDDRTDAPAPTTPVQDEPVTVVQPVVSEPVVLQPVSSAPTVSLDFMGLPVDADIMSRWERLVQSKMQKDEEMLADLGVSFGQTLHEFEQKSSAQEADELARYARMSELERQLAMNRVLFNERRLGNSISSESVSRESVGATSGSLIDEKGDVVGVVQLTTSKVKKATSGEAVCDVTVQITDLNGKRTVSKTKDVVAAEATLAGLGLDDVLPGTLGGSLAVGEAFCIIDFLSGFGKLNVVAELLPLAEPIQCDAKGKWKLGKASKVKLAKGKDGVYALNVDNRSGKTNASGLKLTYKPKSGVFTGSFKLYVLAGTSARPKLTTKQVKVSGLVVDGVGNGTATVPGTDLSWPVLVF